MGLTLEALFARQMTIPLVANRNAMENKSASCPSDHLPEASCLGAACAEPKPNVSTANQPLSTSTPLQPSRIFTRCDTLTSWEYLPLTAHETSHPCESHGMAVERATTCPSFRLAPHPITCFQMPRLTRATTSPRLLLRRTTDGRSVTSMLEPLSCVRHRSCWAIIASRVINAVAATLAICCIYPWVSCERRRTTYAGPPEGTLLRYLFCRVNRIYFWTSH
jgi:hypothetical protein